VPESTTKEVSDPAARTPVLGAESTEAVPTPTAAPISDKGANHEIEKDDEVSGPDTSEKITSCLQSLSINKASREPVSGKPGVFGLTLLSQKEVAQELEANPWDEPEWTAPLEIPEEEILATHHETTSSPSSNGSTALGFSSIKTVDIVPTSEAVVTPDNASAATEATTVTKDSTTDKTHTVEKNNNISNNPTTQDVVGGIGCRVQDSKVQASTTKESAKGHHLPGSWVDSNLKEPHTETPTYPTPSKTDVKGKKGVPKKGKK
jgi:hypothetical protein